MAAPGLLPAMLPTCCLLCCRLCPSPKLWRLTDLPPGLELSLLAFAFGQSSPSKQIIPGLFLPVAVIGFVGEQRPPTGLCPPSSPHHLLLSHPHNLECRDNLSSGRTDDFEHYLTPLSLILKFLLPHFLELPPSVLSIFWTVNSHSSFSFPFPPSLPG